MTTAPAAALDGSYFVHVEGRLYDASYRDGALTYVSITYKTEPGFRRNSGMRKTRRVWANNWYHTLAPTGRAAQIDAMVRDPAAAKKAGARVESPEQRAAYWRSIDDRRAVEARMAMRAAKLAEAAPAMLAALKAVLADAQVQHLDSGVVDMALAAVEAATKA
jgi:hypothetical protein